MHSPKLQKLTILLVIFLAFFVFLSQGHNVLATAMKSLEDTKNIGFGKDSLKITDAQTGIGQLLGVILSLLGLAFFLLIVYAGFKWMFARDNASEVTKAKEMITNAIIGLVVVLTAYAITSFIGGQLTK